MRLLDRFRRYSHDDLARVRETSRDTWQLVINTATTVLTFLAVFLIQNTQNRDARAIPAGAIYDSGDIFGDPHLREREMVQLVDHPTRGPVEILANPIRIDHQPSKLAPAPLLGADTADILRSELGIGDEDLRALRDACVI